MSATLPRVLFMLTHPNRDGPRIRPASSSPSTAGIPSRRLTMPARRAVTRISTRGNSRSMCSMDEIPFSG